MKVKTSFKLLVCLVTALMIFSTIGCQNPSQSSSSNGEQTLEEKYSHMSIADAIEFAMIAGNTPTTFTCTIIGEIVKVSNATYGEMTVADATGEIYVYGSMAEDGTYYDKMAEKPVKGDKVVLSGVVMTYNDEPQMGSKDKKALILDWEKGEIDVNPDEYAQMSVSDARLAEKESKVKVSGVVAKIAYANGMVPCGFILADETSSIYVYDGDVAMQVKEGNKVELYAVKDYWVLASEQANADQHGYKGACQLTQAVLVSNDKGENEIPLSWVEKNTVKGILEAPFDEDITTLIYEVNAIVEEREGTGFTNYYITDLDGKTSGYVYTQCNGSDLDWLKPFDGKLCKVYLTALNAKSTPAECFYRFLPVAVREITDFEYPEAEVPAFAIEYAIADSFTQEVYGADPKIALATEYVNELIADAPVTFEFESSNVEIATVTVDSLGGAVLNVIADGSAEITVTATYKGMTASKVFTVERQTSVEITTPTVAEVIAEEDGTLVQIRGIVISSLVNRSGFYLGDETGIIAVLTDADTLAKIKPGNEVVMEGYKVHFKKETTTSAIGQIAIVGSLEKSSDSKLLANYYGEHEYSTASFDDTKTIDDIYAFDPLEDHTTVGFKVRAEIVVEESQYYSNILVKGENGKNTLRLYCSGSGQYSWLKPYAGQVVEMEIAACNWNDKNYYTGCVISITVDGEKIVNTLNFSN